MRHIMRKGWWMLFAALFPLCRCIGQTVSAVRAELPVAAENDAPFEVLPAGRLGVAVVMRQNDLFAERPGRRIYFYDENLKLRWNVFLPMESTYSYMGYEYEADSLRLFLTTMPEKSREPVFLEAAVCLSDGFYALYPYTADISTLQKPSVMGFARNGVLWHLLLKMRDTYGYCRFLPGNDSLSVRPVASSHEYECIDVCWDVPGDRGCFLFRDAKLEDRNLYAQTVGLSPLSVLVRHLTISPPADDIRLIDARMAVTDRGGLLVAGVWNPASYRQHKSSYDMGSESAGVFTAFYQDHFLKRFDVRPYLDFPDLDGLMSEEEAYRIRNARQKADGRPIQPDYLALPQLWNMDGSFHFLAETYDRRESTVTDYSYDYFGRMVPYTRSRFDGYLYKNAFYVRLDSMGAERLTSVFNIQHLYPEEALASVTAYMEDSSTGRFLYAYTDKGTIYYRGMTSGGEAGAVRSFRLSSSVPGDRVQKTWKEGLVPWFNGVLLSFGHQQVINARRRGKSRQNVFYLNKVVVE